MPLQIWSGIFYFSLEVILSQKTDHSCRRVVVSWGSELKEPGQHCQQLNSLDTSGLPRNATDSRADTPTAIRITGQMETSNNAPTPMAIKTSPHIIMCQPHR